VVVADDIASELLVQTDQVPVILELQQCLLLEGDVYFTKSHVLTKS
jgi:hypothetical protein